jgi:hypothetical protein
VLNFVITQAAQGDLQCRAALFAVNFSHPEYMSARGLNALSNARPAPTPHATAVDFTEVSHSTLVRFKLHGIFSYPLLPWVRLTFKRAGRLTPNRRFFCAAGRAMEGV